MGIASFVIGLICLILSPFLSVFLILPAILGLILGIVSVVIKSKKKEPKGLAIAGIVLSTIALVVCILVTFLLVNVYTAVSDNISDYIDNEESQITEKSAKIGESTTLNDVTVTLVSVDDDFKDYYSFASVDDDCKILKADFEFENVGDYTEYVSYSDFDCYADKFSCDNFSSVEDGYFYASIGKGKKAKGSIYFEVPKDAEKIEIEYDGGSYDGSKITFVVE